MDISSINSSLVSQTINNAKFSKAEKEAKDFEKILKEAGEAASKTESTEDDEALKEMCNEFEKYFLGEMYKSMRNTLNTDNNLFYGGQSEDIFQDLLDQQVVDSAVKAGGIGLAKQLYEQLKSPTSSTGSKMINDEKEKEQELANNENTLDVNKLNN